MNAAKARQLAEETVKSRNYMSERQAQEDWPGKWVGEIAHEASRGNMYLDRYIDDYHYGVTLVQIAKKHGYGAEVTKRVGLNEKQYMLHITW